MNPILLSGLALGLLTTLTACGALPQTESSMAENSSMSASSGDDDNMEPTEPSAYHKITAEQAKQMMDEGSVTVVDVRTAEEYAESHIPDALLVPLESIGDEPPADLPEQDAVLLVYCRTGRRSKAASDLLVTLGYTNVNDFGGIVDWPYDTVTEDRIP